MSKHNEGAKLWGGRFDGATDPTMAAFNASISYDKKMWREDIQGSICYSSALARAGLITEKEKTDIQSGLKKVHEEWNNGSFKLQPEDEDIHTANERRLKELIGPVGGKVHTGRSRNDQVAVDMRMWLKEYIVKLEASLKTLLQVLLERATQDKHILMPGYTHLQRAQPIRWSHWILSHAWALYSDLERLQGVYHRTDVCPLGSGALAGNPFKINREALSSDLGFSSPTPNSLLAVADRDFIVEFLFWASLTCTHLSRMAEDLTLYSTSEFHFVTLSDAYATGSSLMPQKKNPDSLELIRGKAGRISGHLSGFLTVMKGLPSTYNKDLQEDKEFMFDTSETLTGLLHVAAGTVKTLKVHEERCLAALTEDMLATDIAYYLVGKKMPFREAHGKAGEVVKLAEDLKKPFSDLTLAQLQQVSPLFQADVNDLWNFEHSVEQYSAAGGTSLSSVEKQIQQLATKLSNFQVQS